MEKDVAAALQMWRVMNANPRRWCRLTAEQSDEYRTIYVDWGIKHLDGMKERASETLSYSLDSKGEATVTRYAHP